MSREGEFQVMQTFTSGAKRSSRMPRYDLIPKALLDRVAQRFTGDIDKDGNPTGGALKYGEGNWERGLPTSDVINHIINHLTSYQEAFRVALARSVMEGLTGVLLMENVQQTMIVHSGHDDDLAAAAWGIAVLMHQENTSMYHDDSFNLEKQDEAFRLERSNSR